jgi:hypothetical protein
MISKMITTPITMSHLFLFISFFILPFFALSQNVILPVKDGAVQFEYIEEIEPKNKGCSAEQLFLKARSWVAVIFKDAQSVIQLDDKESGRIIGKYVSQIGFISDASRIYNLYANYTMQIDVKECRYRYLITNIYLSSPGTPITRNIDEIYPYYSKGIAPKEYRLLLEGEKGWFKRYNDYFIKILDNSKTMSTSLKIAMTEKTVSNDW